VVWTVKFLDHQASTFLSLQKGFWAYSSDRMVMVFLLRQSVGFMKVTYSYTKGLCALVAKWDRHLAVVVTVVKSAVHVYVYVQ
jgi:hypothetical protein